VEWARPESTCAALRHQRRMAADKCRGDSASSTPGDCLQGIDQEMGDNDCFEPAGYSSLPAGHPGYPGQPGPSHPAKVNGLKLHLPLDEDDYLMPSNGSQPGSGGGYMDLAGDQHQSGLGPSPHGDRAHPFMFSMDNPEYHVVAGQHLLHGSLGGQLPGGGPLSAGPMPGGHLSGGPISGGPFSGGPMSAGPFSGGPPSGGPFSGVSAGPPSVSSHHSGGGGAGVGYSSAYGAGYPANYGPPSEAGSVAAYGHSDAQTAPYGGGSPPASGVYSAADLPAPVVPLPRRAPPSPAETRSAKDRRDGRCAHVMFCVSR